MHRLSLPKLLLGLLVTTAAACGTDSGSSANCEGAKCDALDLPASEIPASPCDGKIVDKSGRRLSGKIAGRLNDPLSKLVFRAGDDCPTGFADIMTKLNAAAAQDGVSCTNRRTMMVSETAQALGQATNYRSVTALDCEQPDGTFGDSQAGVLFSLFGLQAGGGLPDNVEIIAFDKSSGVFNYYETDGNSINFFGNSKDLLKGKGSGGDRRCAGCHTGGGLVMKELAAPWLHWEGDTTTPGAEEFISANTELLGDHSDGIDMESITSDGNRSWNKARIAHLKDVGDTQALLRPLFCTVEVNIESADSSDSGTAEGDVSFASLSGTVFNNRLGFGSLSFSEEQYDGLIRANNQVLRGLPAGNIDTVFGLTSVVPSNIDSSYIDALIEDGILDDSLANAVLAVDFTRSIFSEDRCGLLDSVPGIPLADLNPAAIRAALIAALSGAAEGSPESELLTNLENASGDMSERVSAFSAACDARTDTKSITFQKDGSSQTLDVPGVLVDYMKVVALGRDAARELDVFEFPMTMPSDSQSVPAGTRFNPVDCTLTTDFVPVAEDAPAQACCRTCGANSQACGDACLSLTSTCNQPAGCACEG